MNNTTQLTCPFCKNRLYAKRSGFVCKNHKCSFYWKLGGWSCFESNPKIWVYSDTSIDKHIAWDRSHNYPPRKENISKRHVSAMLAALHHDSELCFVIPERYCSSGSEEVLQ